MAGSPCDSSGRSPLSLLASWAVPLRARFPRSKRMTQASSRSSTILDPLRPYMCASPELRGPPSVEAELRPLQADHAADLSGAQSLEWSELNIRRTEIR